MPGFVQRADRHRMAGAEYGTLRRSPELLETFPPNDPVELRRAPEEIMKRVHILAESAPEVPSRLKEKIDRELNSRAYRRIVHLSAPGAASPGR